MILAIGLVTSYEDIRRGKIRNRWIVAGLLYGLVVYAQDLVSAEGREILPSLLNAVIAATVAYALWLGRWWSAGDAKLFVVFACLIPPSYYTAKILDAFPALTLLVNIFVPAFVVLIGSALRWSATLGPVLWAKVRALRTQKQILGAYVLGGFVVITAGQLLRGTLGGRVNPIVLMLVIFLAYRPLRPLMEKKGAIAILSVILFLLLAVRLALRPESSILVLLGELGRGLTFLAVFAVVMAVLNSYSEEVGVRKVKVEALAPGMTPAGKSVELISETLGGRTLYPEGLTREDITQIRRACPHDLELEVHRSMPFAPIAFAGVLITLALRQSIIHALAVALAHD